MALTLIGAGRSSISIRKMILYEKTIDILEKGKARIGLFLEVLISAYSGGKAILISNQLSALEASG